MPPWSGDITIRVKTYTFIAREAKKLLPMNVSIYRAPIARSEEISTERVKTLCTIMHANYYMANLLATYHSYVDKHFQLEAQNPDPRDIGEYV